MGQQLAADPVEPSEPTGLVDDLSLKPGLFLEPLGRNAGQFGSLNRDLVAVPVGFLVGVLLQRLALQQDLDDRECDREVGAPQQGHSQAEDGTENEQPAVRQHERKQP